MIAGKDYIGVLPEEDQHWVSPSFLCKIIEGVPGINEPEKCSEIGWFSLEEVERLPLSSVVKSDLKVLQTMFPSS